MFCTYLGGPQVRPKCDIFLTSTIHADKFSPDTLNTSKLSVSNALDEPNSFNSAPATEQIETTNHDSARTPLITIKTGKYFKMFIFFLSRRMWNNWELLFKETKRIIYLNH